MTKKKTYDNDSISSLKGADRVRKRPGVIFGSDGLEGCEHAMFEILSNAIDEARAGYGRLITVTRFADLSIQVEDQGRGCPVDWNEKEGRYNWELVFCELYAGGKYDNENSDNYEYSLGLNGLGSCATQYASRYMDVTVCRDGKEYRLHFERGEIAGEMRVTELKRRHTGSTIRWLPDLEVFTDIDIPADYYREVLRRQAVVNAGVTFRLRCEVAPGKFETEDFLYEHGIRDYLAELAGDDPLTEPVCWETERRGRDRADKPEYKVKLNIAWCFSNRVHLIEHYHNSSFLEYGGSPDKATRLAFVYAIDKYLKENNKYTKGESKITFPDVQDCLVLVSSNFSTQTSYENQTKKAITNKFVQDAMSEFLREQLQVYFIENREAAERIANQVLVNKRSRETAERTRLNTRKKLTEKIDIANRVQKFVDCRTKDVSRREIGGAGEGRQGAESVRFEQPPLEQGGHLHRWRRGRLPDPYPDPHHALPALPHPHQGGLRLHCRDAAVRDHLQGKNVVCLLRKGEGGGGAPAGGQEVQGGSLQGTGRERPGDDVADHHESGDPEAGEGTAGRRRGDGPCL